MWPVSARTYHIGAKRPPAQALMTLRTPKISASPWHSVRGLIGWHLETSGTCSTVAMSSHRIVPPQPQTCLVRPGEKKQFEAGQGQLIDSARKYIANSFPIRACIISRNDGSMLTMGPGALALLVGEISSPTVGDFRRQHPGSCIRL